MFPNQFTGRFGGSHFQRGKGSLGFLRTLFNQIGVGRRWGALGITGRELCSLNQGNRKNSAPSPACSLLLQLKCTPEKGTRDSTPEGRRGSGSRCPPFPALPQILIFHFTLLPAPLLSRLLTAATEKEERTPRGTPVSFGLGLGLSATSPSRPCESGLRTPPPHPPARFRLGSVSSERWECRARPQPVRVSPRRGQRCAGSRAAAEPLDSRAQRAPAAKVPVVKNFAGRGRPWKLSRPFLPTGDFSTCRRRGRETVARAGGRSGFPKSPFTFLISVTRLCCTTRSPRGSPFLGKAKVSLLKAAEGPGT